ncbi:MAG: hypothetical protein EZS28_029192, partial [Streblomastix strix]
NPSRRPSAKAILAHDMVRMYLRQHEGRRNIDDSGRIQQLQQEKDDEKRRAYEQKIRADSAEQRIQLVEQELMKLKKYQEYFSWKLRIRTRKYKHCSKEHKQLNKKKKERKLELMNKKMTEKQLEIEARLPPRNEDEDLQELGPITSDPIIPDYLTVEKNENKFIHTKNNNFPCNITLNPIISKGVVRFEIISFGIADVSTVFEPNKFSNEDGNYTKIVLYLPYGPLVHINATIHGNCKFEDKQLVALEVNMSSNPRTLHFFVDNQEQPVSISDIPPNIRFFIGLVNPEQSFTLTRFERIQSSSARGVEGSRVLKWGYEWENDKYYDGNLCMQFLII